MNLENTQIQMRKGILEFCILKVISKGEIYASDMLDELTDAKMMVVEGTLYPLLTRLRKAELVEYKWVESSYGPPRKYYKLTDKGYSFLENLTSTWMELTTATNQILSWVDSKTSKVTEEKEAIVTEKAKPKKEKKKKEDKEESEAEDQ
ncbi:MAG: PadR family transcriptional regulator [Thalassobius sp.]|nr:PadR family transcriptional regulator [Thalassovita sp.]